MNPLPTYRSSAVPQTLQARLDIASAIQTLMARDEDALAQRRTEIEAIRRECEALKRSIQEAGREWLALVSAELRSELKKYSPDQPRVPAGNSDGGQWTSGGGDGSASASTDGSEVQSASRPVQYAALDTGTRTDATPGERDVQVAAGPGRPGYPVDLSEEEQRGGHAIARHVAKSQQYLLSLITDQEMASQRHGDLAAGLKEGSFPSLEAANKLVNSTIA